MDLRVRRDDPTTGGGEQVRAYDRAVVVFLPVPLDPREASSLMAGARTDRVCRAVPIPEPLRRRAARADPAREAHVVW